MMWGDRKLSRDLLWTLGSFVFMGLSGLALNFAIGRFYGPETLGAFSQVFALYLVLSQFAVVGVWLSALKHVSEHAHDRVVRSVVLASALRLAIGLATVATIVAGLLAGPIGTVTGSPAVEQGWTILLPGFWAYSVNKVWMAALNGVRDMRAYALAQMGRYAMMLVCLAIAVKGGLDGVYLPLVLGVPELCLFPIFALYCRRYFDAVAASAWVHWVRIHWDFGVRGFLSGALAELNNRVDIIVLGMFSTDARIGIYAMAAMIAEGLAQFAAVLRDNLNPLLAQAASRGDRDELRRLARRSIISFYAFMGVLLTVAAIVYPHIVALATGGNAFEASWVIFSILALGIALGAGYLPLNMILVQSGFPGRGTLFRLVLLVTTVGLNLALVPLWDILGAAVAMGLSFIAAALYLRYFVFRYVGIRV